MGEFEILRSGREDCWKSDGGGGKGHLMTCLTIRVMSYCDVLFVCVTCLLDEQRCHSLYFTSVEMPWAVVLPLWAVAAHLRRGNWSLENFLELM